MESEAEVPDQAAENEAISVEAGPIEPTVTQQPESPELAMVENVDQPLPEKQYSSADMEEIRTWWEVPCVAHFCSLFRAAFDLPDFDIEELEEALLSSGTPEGSMLMCDLISQLLNGCYGRNDIKMYNFEVYMKDLFKMKWQVELEKKNPLEDTLFQNLDTKTKLNMLQALCDFRLDADDVQDLLKGLDGDNLRVEPMGRDNQGATYWYFYGVRLYKEDPEPEPDPKQEQKQNKKKQNTKKKKKEGKKKKKQTKKQKKRVSAPEQFADETPSRRKNRSSRRKELAEEDEEEDIAATPTRSRSRRSRQNGDSAQYEANQDDAESLDATLDEEVQECEENGEKAAPEHDSIVTPSATPSSQQGRGRSRKGKRNLVEEVSKAEEEEDGSVQQAPKDVTPSRRSKKGKKSVVEEVTKAEEEEDASVPSPAPEDVTPSRRSSRITRKRIEQIAEYEEDVPSPVAQSNGSRRGQRVKHKVEKEDSDEDDYMPDDDSEEEYSSDDVSGSRRKRYTNNDEIPLSLLMRGPPSPQRWHLICSTLEDWQALAESMKGSKVRCERSLYKTITEDFLPEIPRIVEEKERDMRRRALEMAPRRTSCRLEEKQKQREEEERLLAAQQAEEDKRRQEEEESRRKILEQEKLEIQRRQREEREKQRERQREEREKAVEKRAKRAQQREEKAEMIRERERLLAEGKELPPELQNLDSIGHRDLEEEEDLEKSDSAFEEMYSGMTKLLHTIKAHDDSWPFWEPVKEEFAPDYFEVVKKPMDLLTIERKLDNKEYHELTEFTSDFRLLFVNCERYNGENSDFTYMSRTLEKIFNTRIKMLEKKLTPKHLPRYEEDDDFIPESSPMAAGMTAIVKPRPKRTTVVQTLHNMQAALREDKDSDDGDSSSSSKSKFTIMYPALKSRGGQDMRTAEGQMRFLQALHDAKRQEVSPDFVKKGNSIHRSTVCQTNTVSIPKFPPKPTPMDDPVKGVIIQKNRSQVSFLPKTVTLSRYNGQVRTNVKKEEEDPELISLPLHKRIIEREAQKKEKKKVDETAVRMAAVKPVQVTRDYSLLIQKSKHQSTVNQQVNMSPKQNVPAPKVVHISLADFKRLQAEKAKVIVVPSRDKKGEGTVVHLGTGGTRTWYKYADTEVQKPLSTEAKGIVTTKNVDVLEHSSDKFTLLKTTPAKQGENSESENEVSPQKNDSVDDDKSPPVSQGETTPIQKKVFVKEKITSPDQKQISTPCLKRPDNSSSPDGGTPRKKLRKSVSWSKNLTEEAPVDIAPKELGKPSPVRASCLLHKSSIHRVPELHPATEDLVVNDAEIGSGKTVVNGMIVSKNVFQTKPVSKTNSKTSKASGKKRSYESDFFLDEEGKGEDEDSGAREPSPPKLTKIDQSDDSEIENCEDTPPDIFSDPENESANLPEERFQKLKEAISSKISGTLEKSAGVSDNSLQRTNRDEVCNVNDSKNSGEVQSKPDEAESAPQNALSSDPEVMKIMNAVKKAESVVAAQLSAGKGEVSEDEMAASKLLETDEGEVLLVEELSECADVGENVNTGVSSGKLQENCEIEKVSEVESQELEEKDRSKNTEEEEEKSSLNKEDNSVEDDEVEHPEKAEAGAEPEEEEEEAKAEDEGEEEEELDDNQEERNEDQEVLRDENDIENSEEDEEDDEEGWQELEDYHEELNKGLPEKEDNQQEVEGAQEEEEANKEGEEAEERDEDDRDELEAEEKDEDQEEMKDVTWEDREIEDDQKGQEDQENEDGQEDQKIEDDQKGQEIDDNLEDRAVGDDQEDGQCVHDDQEEVEQDTEGGEADQDQEEAEDDLEQVVVNEEELAEEDLEQEVVDEKELAEENVEEREEEAMDTISEVETHEIVQEESVEEERGVIAEEEVDDVIENDTSTHAGEICSGEKETHKNESDIQMEGECEEAQEKLVDSSDDSDSVGNAGGDECVSQMENVQVVSDVQEVSDVQVLDVQEVSVVQEVAEVMEEEEESVPMETSCEEEYSGKDNSVISGGVETQENKESSECDTDNTEQELIENEDLELVAASEPCSLNEDATQQAPAHAKDSETMPSLDSSDPPVLERISPIAFDASGPAANQEVKSDTHRAIPALSELDHNNPVNGKDSAEAKSVVDSKDVPVSKESSKIESHDFKSPLGDPVKRASNKSPVLASPKHVPFFHKMPLKRPSPSKHSVPENTAQKKSPSNSPPKPGIDRNVFSEFASNVNSSESKTSPTSSPSKSSQSSPNLPKGFAASLSSKLKGISPFKLPSKTSKSPENPSPEGSS